MKKYWFKLMTTAVFLSAMPAMVNAQDFQSPEYAAPTQAAYSQAQLEQMLAPIALYPDQLVAQILMAATYPLEVVQAERWLQNQQNASLKGGELSALWSKNHGILALNH